MRQHVRLGPAAGLAVVLALFLLVACAGAAGAPGGARVAKVSGSAPNGNAEVEQAVDGRYVYEAWIKVRNGIGFARSVDRGRTFGPASTVPGSLAGQFHAWDPAVAVAPDGTLYVAYMMVRLAKTPKGPMRLMTPTVAVSHDHGKSFDRVSPLPVPSPTTPPGNWGDREFIAVGPNGTVYVTWDYGPRLDEVRDFCPPSGSCAFSAGDFNAVLQKSSNGGATWTMPTAISPRFPLGGVYAAPIVAEPNGALDVLYWQHPTDPQTLKVSRGLQYFTRSTNGGSTWSTPLVVGRRAGTISLLVWWIDGDLARDPAGNLYAAWDTQRGSRDTGWLAWSTNSGKRWSAPLRVAGSKTMHLTQVAAVGPRDVYVAWQTPVAKKGYATFLRRLAVGKGWTGPAKRISPRYGNRKVWPGDTFGLTTRGGSAVVSWGSAVGKRKTSDIWSTVVTLPAP